MGCRKLPRANLPVKACKVKTLTALVDFRSMASMPTKALINTQISCYQQ